MLGLYQRFNSPSIPRIRLSFSILPVYRLAQGYLEFRFYLVSTILVATSQVLILFFFRALKKNLHSLLYLLIFSFIRYTHTHTETHTHTHTHTYIYIYIYILSTSIHGYQKKRKKKRQEQEIKISSITARGKLKKYHRTKKEKANPVTPVEKNQEICSQLVKRKIKPTVNAAMLQLQECPTRVEPITKLALIASQNSPTKVSPQRIIRESHTDDPLRWNFSRRIPTRDLS